MVENEESPVGLEVSDGVALITLLRPRVLNAIDDLMLRTLRRTVAHLAASSEVRAVCFTGAGNRAFSVGADLHAFAALDAAGRRAWVEAGHALFDAIAGLPQPTLALIRGYALGGGCELALACDLRFAADDAQLGFPEITLGWIPCWGGISRLVTLIGAARAKELILLGDRVSASDACQWGLVHRLFPTANFPESGMEIALSLASREPRALRLAKAALAQVDAPTPRAAFEALALAELADLPQALAAMEQFQARRA